MSETKATPGPWAWKDDREYLGLYGPNNEAVVRGVWRNDGGADCEPASEANGRLIASAPELLTALKYCRMVLYSCGEDTAGTPKEDFFSRTVKTCDSVIAKAEGQ